MSVTSNRFCGFDLDPAIFNASIPVSLTEEGLHELGRSRSGAILIKSVTPQALAGNEEPRYFEDSLGAINSLGIPNQGPEYFTSLIPQLQEYEKPIFASIAGMNTEDYVSVAKQFVEAKVDALEINMSCPNIVGKPIVAYDFDASKSIINSVKKVAKGIPVGVKLPPYPDPIFNVQMAEVIKSTHVSFITCINTIPQACMIDPKTEKFVLKAQFGGLSGKYIKPVALGQVRRFYELLEGKFPIVGCGGISKATDIMEHFLAGASAVQIGTQVLKESPRLFARLERDLIKELKKKDCTLAELTGRAKPA